MAMVRPLKMFMRGKNVSMLQDMLRGMGYRLEDKLGMFGASTRDAVKDFQRQRTLKVTGQVDYELLQIMQGIVGGESAQINHKNIEASNFSTLSGMASKQKFDALLALMIRKGLLTEKEFNDELFRVERVKEEADKVVPTSITQPPLV